VMLHGQRLGGLKAQVRAPGVTLRRTIALPNPNYLVVELDVAPHARPGPLTITLKRGATPVLRQPYELRARARGSAQRAGFGPADAVYLVVPDRFADGDPANDSIAELGDPAQRADPGGRHGGDLHGLAQHLDYIAGMGFTQIWPTPLVENHAPRYSYHGYAATDLYRIDPRFGSNEGYRQFVAQARARGLGVIQDVVLNHIGSGHGWMADLPTPDWLNQHASYTETNHRLTTAIDPHAARVDARAATDGWFVPSMPDLNQRQPLLATYLIQNALWWIEYAGLSGLRVDTYPYSDKAFLAHWSGAVMAEYPKFNLVGETMTQLPALVAYWQRGQRNRDGYVSHMPSMMDFPLHGALHLALVEPEGRGYSEGFGRLYEALANDVLYAAPNDLMLFEGNHDTARIFSVLGEDLALNRMAMVLVATLPRVPQLLYGSEILMTSPTERDDGLVRADFPGGWPGDTVNAFTGAGLSDAQRDAQAFARKLLTWRKAAVAVHRGQLIHFAPDRGTYTYFRIDAASRRRVMVVLNKSTAEVALDMARFAEVLPSPAHGTDVITGQTADLGLRWVAPPRSATVIEFAR
jgi:neopullulanase